MFSKFDLQNQDPCIIKYKISKIDYIIIDINNKKYTKQNEVYLYAKFIKVLEPQKLF